MDKTEPNVDAGPGATYIPTPTPIVPPTGAQGVAGAQGPTGAQNIIGAQNPTGSQGATGSQVITGTQGAIGAQTPTGSQGTQSATGTQASTGLPDSVGATGALANSTVDASQLINDLLTSWGLGDLASTVWGNFKAGDPAAKITDYIRSTPQYSARFPGIAALAKKGQAISESDYISKEVADESLMRNYLGTSSGIWTDRNTLGSLIANQVSTSELQSRLQATQDSVMNADPAIKQYLKDNYGLTDGDIASYYLNPDKALADIQRRAAAGQLGGIAAETGFGKVSTSQVESLANQGVSNAQAFNTFGQLGKMGQLTQALPGDTSGSLTQQQLLDMGFSSNADATAAYDKVTAARKAELEQGGQFAATQQGVVGLGSATRGT